MTAMKSQGATLHISSSDADTTAYGSATFVQVGELQDIGEPSGSATKIDVTNLSSTEKEYLIGLPDEGDLQISGLYDPNDTGQNELETAKGAQNRRWLKITFSDSTVRYAKALVMKYAPGLSIDSKVGFTASFAISGAWVTA